MKKNKILYIVEAMGGGVFTYIVDLANELVNEYDMYIAYDGYNILDLDDDNHLFGRYFNNRDNSNVGNRGGNIGIFELRRTN